MYFLISEVTAGKLKEKHRVTEQEVIECFQNRTRKALIDDREEHRTYPPTKWFISKTDAGRELKIVFVPISPVEIVVKTAYEPNEKVKRIYKWKT